MTTRPARRDDHGWLLLFALALLVLGHTSAACIVFVVWLLSQ